MNSVLSAYQKIASRYETILGSISMFAREKIEPFFASLPPGARVLDAGCGPGLESEIAVTHGLVMTGVDGSSEMLQRYQDKVPGAAALLADVTEIPLASQSFDALFSSCVLLHLERPQALQALQEFHRLLVAGGPMFLVTSVASGEDDWHSRPALQDVGVDKLYFHHWEKQSLLEAIASVGFEVIQEEVQQTVPGRPGLIFIRANKSQAVMSATIQSRASSLHQKGESL